MRQNLYSLIIQKPYVTQNPGDSGGIDLTRPFDLIVFIILPIVIVILYFIWKQQKKRDKNEKIFSNKDD